MFGDEPRPVVAKRRELAAAVAQLHARVRALEAQTRTDALTGLLNRRALDEVMEVRAAASQPAGMAVVFVDIDHFGDYNHLHGDARGDEALCAVAGALRRCARDADDMVFRKGGEEFAVVLFGIEADAARAAAQRLCAAVEALGIAHVGSDAAPVVTVTVGLAFGTADETVSRLLARASDRVMAAKQRGERNTVHVA